MGKSGICRGKDICVHFIGENEVEEWENKYSYLVFHRLLQDRRICFQDLSDLSALLGNFDGKLVSNRCNETFYWCGVRRAALCDCLYCGRLTGTWRPRYPWAEDLLIGSLDLVEDFFEMICTTTCARNALRPWMVHRTGCL